MSAVAHSHHLTVPCSRCGGAAAEFSLLPATPVGESLWHDRDRLERSEFMGLVTKFGEFKQLMALFDAVRRGNYAAARAVDPDFAAFHCLACNRVYCEQCWAIGAPVFDEGFYDYTTGTCPAGHEQVVDD